MRENKGLRSMGPLRTAVSGEGPIDVGHLCLARLTPSTTFAHSWERDSTCFGTQQRHGAETHNQSQLRSWLLVLRKATWSVSMPTIDTSRLRSRHAESRLRHRA